MQKATGVWGGVCVLLAVISGSALGGPSSPDGIWSAATVQAGAGGEAGPWVATLKSYRLVRLGQPGLQKALAGAPAGQILRADRSPAVITLPMPDGSFQSFRFVESAVMHPQLAAKYPQIKTYVGQGIDDPHAGVCFDWTPRGFRGYVRSPDGTAFVEPYSPGQTDLYVSFYQSDVKPDAAKWTCYTDDNEVQALGDSLVNQVSATWWGQQLLTYRLAVAATGEYTQYHGGVTQAVAAIASMVNRINLLYGQEFSINFQLVANNDLIVYADPATDPYSGSHDLDENQSNTDSVIGSANYDMGHLLDIRPLGNASGVAILASACIDGIKAKGTSGSCYPGGDWFYTQITAHEMGHQMGSHHTWNGTDEGCSVDQWGGNVAREPGSGSTIMAYAGSCGVDNLQDDKDVYFHAISQERIRQICTSGSGTCAVVTATGNTPPVVTVPTAYTIPHRTPFTLTAWATDADGDPVTYCWEEMDYGPQAPLSAGDNGSSPIFRSWLPSASPTRVFPRLSDLLNNNTLAKGEILPTKNRSLRMRCTVRDNRAGGGGVATADTQLTVTTAAGPFRLAYPNGLNSVSAGAPFDVTWNVASTNTSAVNPVVNYVRILLSKDGGATFPVVLANDTPNDGNQSVTIPVVHASNSARIKVEATTNIFFDISDRNFSILCPSVSMPTNPSASQGTRSDAVEVSWSPPASAPGGLDHYEIRRNTAPEVGTSALLSNNWTSTTYLDSTATPGVGYYYWIKAVNSCGMASYYSATGEGWRSVPAPHPVTASDGTHTSHVQIGWGLASSFTTCKIYRNTTNDFAGATVLVPSLTMLLYNDTTAIPGATYYYWIQAFNSNVEHGTSAVSNPDAGWRALSPPYNFLGTMGTYTTHVGLQWNAAAGATHYRIYRNTVNDSGQATALTSWITGTNYYDMTAAPGVLYYYWARSAASDTGYRASTYSLTTAGWRGLQAPLNVWAGDGSNWGAWVKIVWNQPVGGAAYYRVYRNTVNNSATATALGDWDESCFYYDTTAVLDQVYYYWVRAAGDDQGQRIGPFSAPDTGYRANPTFPDCNSNGVWDRFEPDTDGDGFIDDCDNCPYVDNERQGDRDGDGLGNECDNCSRVANPDQNDIDVDTVGDVCDLCPGFDDRLDADGDGVPDACDACPGFDDRTDADGDGIADGCDNCPSEFNDDQADGDGDGIGNACDNCPAVSNAGQDDTDGDGVGNVCDNCPITSNPDQQNSDTDAFGDACDNCPPVTNATQADSDGDAVGNACDNCRSVVNPDQADGDADGVGDACDNCPLGANPDQANFDKDSFGDVCDNCPSQANVDQADDDMDGVGDACDQCPGTIPGAPVDMTGCPPWIPPDFDRDGDVDMTDFLEFQECASAPAVAYVGTPLCQTADFDADGDVDQTDFALWQRCYSGEGGLSDPSCMN